MYSEQSLPHPIRRFEAETALLGAGVLLLLVPWLFVSSPDYREVTLLVFGIVAICLAWWIPDLRPVIRARIMRLTIACIVIVHLSSLVGGLQHGAKVGMTLLEFLTGISGILGMGIFTWILLRPRWRPWAWRTFIALTIVLVVGSLLGFLVFNQWQEDLIQHTPHMDTRRLSLVWAPRLLTGELGRQFWAHANTAAFLFAAAWVVLVDALFRQTKRAMAGWALALLLGVAIFLTASRSGWVMVILALPALLAFRPWRYGFKVLALLTLAVILGSVAVHQHAKPEIAGQTQNAAPADFSDTIHLGQLAERGSSGRLSAYRILWDDLENERLFGQGLAVTREPTAFLLHEHSSYLATLRGGGFVALVAHLVLIGCVFWAAILLSRAGCRWPLLLAIAVFSGLLFDRSTVFRLTGFDEFPMHWLASWIPLAMWSHAQIHPSACDHATRSASKESGECDTESEASR